MGLKVFHDAAAAREALGSAWLTVGNFDGVHLGHQHILKTTRDRAEADGKPCLGVTFRPHPASVLSDAGGPERLCSDRQQAELFDHHGFAGLLHHPFTLDFARLSAESFHRDFLCGALNMAGIVVGEDFGFGAHRGGNVALLTSLSAAQGDGAPKVLGLAAVQKEGGVVSSSRIRKLVTEGKVEDVEKLLARPFAVEGRVVTGEGRGRGLGFATANVEPREVMTPGTGVYVCVYHRDEELLPAVVNVGRRPTFGPRAVGIEAHVLDFEGTLLGEQVRLSFLARLRGEKRFAGAEELIAQIGKDVEAAREVLVKRTPESLRGIPAC